MSVAQAAEIEMVSLSASQKKKRAPLRRGQVGATVTAHMFQGWKDHHHYENVSLVVDGKGHQRIVCETCKVRHTVRVLDSISRVNPIFYFV